MHSLENNRVQKPDVYVLIPDLHTGAAVQVGNIPERGTKQFGKGLVLQYVKQAVCSYASNVSSHRYVGDIFQTQSCSQVITYNITYSRTLGNRRFYDFLIRLTFLVWQFDNSSSQIQLSIVKIVYPIHISRMYTKGFISLMQMDK